MTKVSKLTVEFEWDDKDLGEGWFNIDNLAVLLYSRQFTTREILKVREVGFATSDEELCDINRCIKH